MASLTDDKVERVMLYIDSKDRTTGTNESFSVTMASEITRVKQVEVVSVEIPFSYYVITASNNNLRFQDSEPIVFNAAVPAGNYDATSFCTALQTAINGVLSGSTVTYNATTMKISIVTESSISLRLTGSTIASVIGLSANTSLSTTSTPQQPLNLSGPNYLMISSSAIMKLKSTQPFWRSAKDDVLHKMTVGTVSGTILIDKPIGVSKIQYSTRQKIQTIDLQLTDPDGVAIDLNGQRWSLTLALDLL